MHAHQRRRQRSERLAIRGPSGANLKLRILHARSVRWPWCDKNKAWSQQPCDRSIETAWPGRCSLRWHRCALVRRARAPVPEQQERRRRAAAWSFWPAARPAPLRLCATNVVSKRARGSHWPNKRLAASCVCRRRATRSISRLPTRLSIPPSTKRSSRSSNVPAKTRRSLSNWLHNSRGRTRRRATTLPCVARSSASNKPRLAHFQSMRGCGSGC